MTKETEMIIEVAWPFVLMGVALLSAISSMRSEKKKKFQKIETTQLKGILKTAPIMQKMLAFMAITRVSRDSKQDFSSSGETFSHVLTKTNKIGEMGKSPAVMV